MIRILANLIIFSTLSSAAYAQTKKALPNQPARSIEAEDGTRNLVGWIKTKPLNTRMSLREVPEERAFKGSKLWMIRTPESESEKAALLSFSEAGMGRAKIIAKTGLSPNAIDVLDSHKNAKGYSIFVISDISGEPAYGIALVLYGSLDDGK